MILDLLKSNKIKVTIFIAVCVCIIIYCYYQLKKNDTIEGFATSSELSKNLVAKYDNAYLATKNNRIKAMLLGIDKYYKKSFGGSQIEMYRLDGIKSYINVPNINSKTLSTVCVFQANNQSDNGTILATGDLVVRKDSNAVKVYSALKEVMSISLQDIYTTDNIYFMALIVDNGKVTLYVNNAKQEVNLSTQTIETIIYGANMNKTNFFNGNIGRILVYRSAKTLTDLLSKDKANITLPIKPVATAPTAAPTIAPTTTPSPTYKCGWMKSKDIVDFEGNLPNEYIKLVNSDLYIRGCNPYNEDCPNISDELKSSPEEICNIGGCYFYPNCISYENTLPMPVQVSPQPGKPITTIAPGTTQAPTQPSFLSAPVVPPVDNTGITIPTVTLAPTGDGGEIGYTQPTPEPTQYDSVIIIPDPVILPTEPPVVDTTVGQPLKDDIDPEDLKNLKIAPPKLQTDFN